MGECTDDMKSCYMWIEESTGSSFVLFLQNFFKSKSLKRLISPRLTASSTQFLTHSDYVQVTGTFTSSLHVKFTRFTPKPFTFMIHLIYNNKDNLYPLEEVVRYLL